MEIRPLRPEDDRSQFASGQPDLDLFLRRYAGQNQFKLHIGTTYVAVDDGVIVGFFTIAATSIEIDELPVSVQRRMPRYPLPALRLARLAVARQVHGRGLGGVLLAAVCSLAKEMAEAFGCVGVVVDAKAEAVEFYATYGFETVDDVLTGEVDDVPPPTLMFLPLGRIP